MNPYISLRRMLVLTLFPTILLMAGCTAPLFPSLPSGLSGSQTSSRSASRAPLTQIPAAAPTACDRAAYEAGYKMQYARHWNYWRIRNKETLYRLKSQQHPGDRAAQWNYALYRGKELGGQAGDAGVTAYGLELDGKGRIRNDCEARSFTQGETAGMRAAGRDLKALAGEEL